MNDVLAPAIEAAEAQLSPERLIELCTALVDVASPTGGEAFLATRIAELLGTFADEAHVQPLDDHQANAWGALNPTVVPADGPTLMLYSPVDTLTTGDPAEDLPWASERRGAGLADHQLPRAVVDGDVIRGLGAMNPKGHAACVLAAAEAIARSGPARRGRLVVAFGAGGMPTESIGATPRRNTGHGAGCSFLLERGVWADAAVIAKSHWSVAHDEVGLAWCDVIVRGRHTYVGARHRLPYRNPIDDAALIVQHLEDWFPERAERHRTATLLPQGIVSSVHSGWTRMAAVVPAEARIRVDLRVTPDQTPLQACRELDAQLDVLRAADQDLDVSVELVLGIPGSRTDPCHWVCRETIEAWESVTGTAHRAATEGSGATDANILRNRGIPTARVGLPKVVADGAELGFAEGMNTVTVTSMLQLTRLLVRTSLRCLTAPLTVLDAR